MFFWPILIVAVTLIIACVLFYMLPEVIDHGMSFLWIVAGFLILYIGAALYLSRSIPAWSQSDTSNVIQDQTTESSVPDVIAQ